MNLITFGNSKLPKTTLIFNMGSSKDCPSRKLGVCSCDDVCYARQPEKMYPSVLPYRERQADFWLDNDADTIAEFFGTKIARKRIKTKLFRFNEAGDFYSQECVEKLDKVSHILKKRFGITTYGYTARKDLNFSDVSFKVKGSDNNSGNNGKTIVVATKNDVPEGFVMCPGSCKTCRICVTGKNVAFVKH